MSDLDWFGPIANPPSPGVCPTCGTDLDHDEINVGDGWFEAFCCVCSRYVRKRLRAESMESRS